MACRIAIYRIGSIVCISKLSHIALACIALRNCVTEQRNRIYSTERNRLSVWFSASPRTKFRVMEATGILQFPESEVLNWRIPTGRNRQSFMIRSLILGRLHIRPRYRKRMWDLWQPISQSSPTRRQHFCGIG